MKVDVHLVQNKDGHWVHVETICVENCFAHPDGTVTFEWDGIPLSWELPGWAVSALRATGSHFAMDCTFVASGSELEPTGVVIGAALIERPRHTS